MGVSRVRFYNQIFRFCIWYISTLSLYAYRDWVFSVEIWLQARWFGIRISAGAIFFLFSEKFKLAVERTQPPVQ